MPKAQSQTCIIAYIPVLHKGYLNLFSAHPDAHTMHIIDRVSLSDEHIEYLRKDLRQLEVTDAVKLVEGLQRFTSVEVYNDAIGADLDITGNKIILPDEDISRIIGATFKKATVMYYGVFLRWDRRSLEHTNEARTTNERASINIKHVELMNKALDIANVSTDIWRRVGAVLVAKNNKAIDSGSNKAEPTKFSPWIEGDPRNIFNRGVAIEMSVFTHAEALLIARAARHGVSLDGASIYVTDFPCPACAKIIAHSGINRVYYKEGYAVLDGERVMKDYGVTISQVNVDEGSDPHPEVWVPYKKG